jgi:hypothetical protein
MRLNSFGVGTSGIGRFEPSELYLVEHESMLPLDVDVVGAQVNPILELCGQRL